MALRYAVANGNWSALATWDGGASLPGAGDDVYANNKTVTIDQDVTVLSVRTTAGGSAVAGGGFKVLANGYTVTANIFAGASDALNVSANTTIIGNAFGSTTSAPSSGCGIRHYAGNLSVIGNLQGGSIAVPCMGCYSNATSITITVTGDCIGGSSAGYCSGLYIQGVITSLSVYGAAIGGVGTADCFGVNLNAPPSSSFVQVARSNNYPNDGITNAKIGLSFGLISVHSQVPVIDALECGSGGLLPIGNRVFVRDAGTNFVKMRQSNNGAITVMGEVSNDYPAPANVRTGIAYDFGAKTGTCAVPPAGSVALGVPVDATTGTAVLGGGGSGLTAADVWSHATRSLTDKADFALTAAYDPAKTAAPTAAANAAAVRSELATELGRIDQPVSAAKTLTGAYDAAKTAASSSELAAAVAYILSNLPAGITPADIWTHATRSLTQDVGLSPALTARLENCATVQTVGDQLAAMGV